MSLDLLKYLKIMSEQHASDLHLKVGAPPILRINGQLALASREAPCVAHKEIQEAIQPLLNPMHQNMLLENKQVDFSHGVKGLGRFRFNVFFQRGTLRVVARHIPFKVPDFKDLNLPKTLADLMSKKNGLILVTGATGNGKSSTIVAMLDYVNRHFSRHIITIEDPIEFLIQDKKSLITQRELGADYLDYKLALKASLRQDPDIIFFGELRDTISTEMALNAANTGHLVLSTLHTNNAAETMIRLLGMFSEEKQAHVRQEFASCLRAIVCQRLVMRKDKNGFYPVLEILINNPRVKELLEDEKKSVTNLNTVIESSQDVWGMQSFNQHLQSLYSEGIISKEAALSASDSPENLRLFFSGLGSHESTHTSTSLRSVEDLEQEEEGYQNLTLEMVEDERNSRGRFRSPRSSDKRRRTHHRKSRFLKSS